MEEPENVAALIQETRARLLQTQHTPSSLQRFERVWQEFERFADGAGAAGSLREVGARFLADRYGLELGADPGPTGRLAQDRLRATEVLLDVAAHHPLTIRRRRAPAGVTGAWAPVMAEFIATEKRAGRAARTGETHLLYLGRVAAVLEAAGVATPAALTPRVLTDLVSQTGRQYSRSTQYCTAGLLRGFLRYLHREGQTARNLAAFIPPVAGVKQAHGPANYGPDEIARLLAAVDRANPKGRRDDAMLLLACRLGLRASDICRLTVTNLHWDTSTLVITQQKTGHPLTLPLLTEVGTALIDYLQQGRPSVGSPTVFLRHTAPVGPLTPATLHSIVRHYRTRAGVAVPPGKKHGPHALRHSLASALLRHETPLPVITAVLGHQDTRTTGTYLRIDLPPRRRLAWDVPPLPAAGWGGARP